MGNEMSRYQTLPLLFPGSYLDRIDEARRHMDRQEWQEAATILQRVVQRINGLPEQRRLPHSDPAEFRNLAASSLVTALAKLGDWEGATELCRHLQEWDEETIDHWRRQVHVLEMERGDVETGQEGLLAIATAEPDRFWHWMALAQESLMRDQTRYVEDALAQAERLAGRVETAEDDLSAPGLVHVWRFYLYRLQGRWDEAGEAWRLAASSDAEIAENQEIVVLMYLEAGLPEKAERYLDEAVLGKNLVLYYQALIAYQRGDRVRAQHLWRQALAAIDEDEEYVNPALRAMVLCHLGESRLALAELLEDYQASRTYSVRTAIALALGWAMEGNLEAALTNLELAREGAMDTPHHQGLIDAVDWLHFEQLVADAGIRETLRPYFKAPAPAG